MNNKKLITGCSWKKEKRLAISDQRCPICDNFVQSLLFKKNNLITAQQKYTCSKSTIEILERGVKFI